MAVDLVFANRLLASFTDQTTTTSEMALVAQPQWALGTVVGLPLVAGAVAWLTNWLAEALT